MLSDLHLGSRTDADVLREPRALAALTDALRADPPDRLVLLGDVLELRHGSVADTLDDAEPVLRAIGEALAAAPAPVEVIVVPGNHDHELLAGWMEERALRRETALGLEERADAAVSGALATVAGWLAPARVEVAYPGVWLRPDVYAMHGHFLDRHVTVPTVERIATGIIGRVIGRPAEDAADAEDYEAALAPLYAWMHVVARHTRTGFGAERQKGTQRAWKLLTAKGPRPLRHRALAVGFVLAIVALNRAGAGPLHAKLSAEELRRAGLIAMAEVCRRLEIAADWVIFGHTHRAGPMPKDDPAEWRPLPDGPRLVNSGSWVMEQVFIGRQRRHSVYWPGTVIEVGDEGPPERLNLLREWDGWPEGASED